MINWTSAPELSLLGSKLADCFALAKRKVVSLDATYPVDRGSPVFTVGGQYTSRGWTEWTEGFRYGIAILQFDATGDEEMLTSGRDQTVARMASHVSHVGVHDHGFNNLSTYGNLRRLALEGRWAAGAWEVPFYDLALKVSGAVQAARWTPLPTGGFLHSFNGAHSLFVDTIRSCRVLMVAHRLGHVLMGEGDRKINLLERALQHIASTARYNVFYGEGRDAYDVRGRTCHEAIFNVKDGAFRCPSSQQGYSAFTTWTRGQAWAILGFAEELEFLATCSDAELDPLGGRAHWEALLLKGALATAEHCVNESPTCGVPYWDTGAPHLGKLGDYRNRPAEPLNPWEPVDSSAAAISAQGMLRLGRYLESRQDGDLEPLESVIGSKTPQDGVEPLGVDRLNLAQCYTKAGLKMAETLLAEPYLSTDDAHQGLLLHSIYHRPNGWDFSPQAGLAPYGESSMWGDYHLMELAVYLQRLLDGRPYLTFFA